jgi:hypothetical protein
MLWTRIVGALALLLAATFLIQWLMPRRQSQPMARSRFLRWDLAPVVGFIGAVLLALSLVEASRREMIAQWGWGIALGLVVSAAAWAHVSFGQRRAAARASVWRYVQQYGMFAIALGIGFYLGVRVFGAMLGVFAASALSVGVIAIAIALFHGNAVAEDKGESNGKQI